MAYQYKTTLLKKQQTFAKTKESLYLCRIIFLINHIKRKDYGKQKRT